MKNRKNIASAAPWESTIGYSRAVRIGHHIWVTGTTATDEHGQVVGKGDTAEQTRYVFQKNRTCAHRGGCIVEECGAHVHIRDLYS